MLTIFIVFSSINLAGMTGALPGGLNLPATQTGWLALATLVVLYGTGFIVLFISVPRLDMPRNAPVMNIEPLATLLMGWLVLDQMLSAGQVMGGVIVVTGIVLLTYRKANTSSSVKRPVAQRS
ncbi:EamA-like transporter family protein [compost metagenome]